MTDLLEAETPAEGTLPCKALPCFGVAIILPASTELALPTRGSKSAW